MNSKSLPGDSQEESKEHIENPATFGGDESEKIDPPPESESQIGSDVEQRSSISEDSSTNNSSIETEMEVHHHPQLEHKAKPWKEYLLEGFMIFIAVMMGFFAENIRENITNSEHVRQLTSQLVQELKADTAQLNNIYKGESEILNSNDSLFRLLQQPLGKADLMSIQKFVVTSHSLWMFHPSTGAMNAIKNELRLRQFSNSEIISYMSNYEGHIALLHTVQDIALQYQRTYIDPFLRLHFTPLNLDAAFDRKPMRDAQMRNLTQADLEQLNTDMVLIRINTNELINDNRRLKEDAVHLLQYVTKKFELENE